MFSKMMDTLPEEMHSDPSLGVQHGNTKVAGIAFVDDVASLAIGYTQQRMTLEIINEFAIKHQLEWGENKCKVMEIGTHKEMKTQWDLGDKQIDVCKEYKYLGKLFQGMEKALVIFKKEMGKSKQKLLTY